MRKFSAIVKARMTNLKGVIVMRSNELLKHEIDLLPADMLEEVEEFIKKLKSRKTKRGKPSSLLTKLADAATDSDLPADFSKQHDHYLYGLPKV
jgi:hypothetical protein